MNDDSYVMLHRRDDISKQWVFHARLAPHEVTEDVIAERFGGGTYRCQERVRNGSGSFVIGRTRGVMVAGPYKPPTGLSSGDSKEQKPEVHTGGSGVPGSVNTTDIINTGILQVIQAGAAQQQMMMQMMAQMASQSQTLMQALVERRSDSIDWTQMLAAITPVVTAYLSQPKEKQDPLEMIRTVTEMVKSQAGPKSDMKEIIGLIKSMTELREVVQGESAGSAPTDPLSYIPQLVQVIAERHNMDRGRPTATPQAGQPALPAPQQDVTVPMWTQVLTRQKGTLISMASAGQDPEFVAEMAVRLMPQGIVGSVHEFLALEDRLEQAYAIIPELRQFPTFTTKFLNAIAELMSDDDSEEGEGTGEVSDDPQE